MIQFVALFDRLLVAVRFILVVSAGVFAAFCILDWLVRTRRVNLFGPLARFSRSRIDPVLEPIERRVLSAGGNPASAPLWALVAVVVGGILLVSVLDFIRSEILGLAFAMQSGPAGILKLLVSWTFDFVRIAILVRVVSSWLPISPYSPWIRWAYAVSEPLLKPLRQLIPAIGGAIDITPIIAYFLLGFIQGAVLRMM
ncbi:MAG TPA: YggT family protein [Gemmatimonadaceae bacterium]|nr:YggT family protein [Gemmatimonadaceae bacterium]